MEKIIEVDPIELISEYVEPYGKAVILPDEPAPKKGETWDCWNRLATIGYGNPAVGIVKTSPGFGLIESMERHYKSEILIPVSGGVIQPLALAKDLNNESEQPDVTTVKAFTILPGQAIIMSPGVWHSAALPIDDCETLYFYLTEPSSSENNFGAWVPFKNNERLKIQRGGII